MSKINDYARFVDSCTSETSKDTTKMCDRLDRLMVFAKIKRFLLEDRWWI